jgi:glutathione S-transferase
MILVGQYDSFYTRRVAIALHLLGLPFERNTLSGFADEAAMRKINPLGRIPSLILDDGEVLIDSAAILDHLDERVGRDRALLPASGAARRQALRIVSLATGMVDKAGAVVYERALRPPEKRYEPWLERCRVQVASGLAALEAATGSGYYVAAADRPMQPDVTVACAIDYLRMRFPDALRDGAAPRLEGFTDRFAALEAFRVTAPSPDELMPGRPL